MAIMSVTILESSRMPELSTPAAVFAFINEFLDRVAPAISAADGFVYRYEGYGVSVLFHDGAEAALRSALDMQSRIAAYNIERENRGRKIVRIALGLHSGELALGTVGDDRRMDVTLVSGDFELCSRLVNLALEYDLGIAASERFLSELGEGASCRARRVGKTRGVDKAKPVVVYEMYDEDPEGLGSRKDATRAAFERAVDAWHARRFDEARAAFKEVLAKVPEDGPSLKYLASMKTPAASRAPSKP
jgi:class 3 adenylate cyclase